MNSKRYRLSEVTVNYDAKRRPVKALDRAPGIYPYYGASGVIDTIDRFTHDGSYLLVAEDGENLRSRSTPIAFMAHGQFWVNNHAHVLTGNSVANTKYLSYVIESIDISGYLTGSTQPKLTRSALDSITLSLPSRYTQDGIVEIIDALDMKIQISHIISSNVGALSQAIHKYTRSVSDCSQSTFDEVATVSGGGTPKTGTPEYWGTDINWATPTDITSLLSPYLHSTKRMISEAGLKNCSSKLYPIGSILMTSRATIGSFALAQVPTAVNQGFIVVNSNDPAHQLWVYHDMVSRANEFRSLANGATFLELSRGRFKSISIFIPESDTLAKFTAKVSALHRKGAQAEQEAEILSDLKITLLPKLMSGALRIQDVINQVEEVL